MTEGISWCNYHIHAKKHYQSGNASLKDGICLCNIGKLIDGDYVERNIQCVDKLILAKIEE